MKRREALKVAGAAVALSALSNVEAAHIGVARIEERLVATDEISFGVVGDMPYCEPGNACLCESQHLKYFMSVLDDMNKERMPFCVHVGDVFNGPDQGAVPDESQYRLQAEHFKKCKIPFVVIPGDNEYTDFGNLKNDALNFFRKHFLFVDNETLPHSRQDGRSENIMWSHGGIQFVGINVPGMCDEAGYTALAPLPDNNKAFLDIAFPKASEDNASAVVVFLHAEPRRKGYTDLHDFLKAKVLAFNKPVLTVQGDLHDEPTLKLCFDNVPHWWSFKAPSRSDIGDPPLHWGKITFRPAQNDFIISVSRLR